MIGTSLGPYKIIEQLGAGGMGEVYLGEDTRLGRKVAIKVLPEEYASDPERLARFEQEARAAAALNHPHIAVVHDIGTEGDIHFIVQEYLEGQSLRERLDKGALPLDKVLDLATEVGEALIAAHKAGIIHRDLKPDNIFVTEEGHAKVLDFGLAKLTEIAAPGVTELSMSPTVLGTTAGQVMGTAGYMSPEQVEGDGTIDTRADIFSFGCVLSEMTVGKRAFGGKSVLDTLHAIARTDPLPVGELKPEAPAELGRILDKCLAKEREERYQHADDLLVDLRGLAGELEAGTALSFASASASRVAALPARRLAPLVAAGFVAGAVLAAMVGMLPGSGASADKEVQRYEIKVSEAALEVGFGPSVVLSPDGQTMAYATRDGVWVRRLDSLQQRLIVAGGVGNLVFSPDGERIAYVQDATLWVTRVTGGSPLEVAEARFARGVFWGEADTILLASGNATPIVRVRVDGGGEPEPVTELRGDEETHRFPQLLPGGRAVLFTAHTQRGFFDGANIVVRDLTTGEQRVVLRGGFHGRYVPTGHMVYANDGALFAAPFDIERLAVTGTSVQILDGIDTNSASGAANFGILENGTFVYVPSAGDGGSGYSNTWAFVARDGSVGQTWQTNGYSYGPELSPDGTRLAATVITEGRGQDLWIWDRGRAQATRITFLESSGGFYSAWLPGNRELIYHAVSDEIYRLYRTRADGSGGQEPLPEPHDRSEEVGSISADGRWLLTTTAGADGETAMRVRDLTGEEAPRVMVTAGDLLHADLSPDAQWIAYGSNESGDWEVYAVPLRAEDGDKVAVSVGGGGMPHWSDDGRSIYYRSPNGVVVVDLETVDGQLRPGPPQTLFEGDFYGNVVGMGGFGTRGSSRRGSTGGLNLQAFDAAGDGETFVLPLFGGGPATTTAIVVFNWFEELKQQVPTGGSR